MRGQHCFVSLILTGLFLLPVSVMADAELASGSKTSVVIPDIEVKESVEDVARRNGTTVALERIRDTVQSRFNTAVSESRVFSVVERARLGALLEEQQFQAGLSQQAAPQGQMQGAQFVLLVELDGFEEIVSERNLTAIGRTEVNRKVFASATLRVTDVATSQTLPELPSVMVERALTSDINDVRGEALPGGDRVYVEMGEEIAQVLTQKALNYIRPAKLLNVSGANLVINRGEPAGFVEGGQVVVYEVEVFVDEDTGERFEAEDEIGRAVITRSNDRMSYANLESGEARRGNVVRWVESPVESQSGGQGAPGAYYIPGL